MQGTRGAGGLGVGGWGLNAIKTTKLAFFLSSFLSQRLPIVSVSSSLSLYNCLCLVYFFLSPSFVFFSFFSFFLSLSFFQLLPYLFVFSILSLPIILINLFSLASFSLFYLNFFFSFFSFSLSICLPNIIIHFFLSSFFLLYFSLSLSLSLYLYLYLFSSNFLKKFETKLKNFENSFSRHYLSTPPLLLLHFRKKTKFNFLDGNKILAIF